MVEPSAQQALFDKVVRDRARSMADQLHSGSSHGLLVAMAAIEASNDLSPVQIDAVFFLIWPASFVHSTRGRSIRTFLRI